MLRNPLRTPKRIFAAHQRTRKRLIGVDTTVSDLQLVRCADMVDEDMSFSAVPTTSAEVVRRSPEALLNNANCPLVIPFIQLLYRRGALVDERKRWEVARFLLPSVHREYFPWLWRDDTCGLSVDAMKRDVSVLRSLPPSAWRVAVDHSPPPEPSDRLHYWHQVFFSLASNPAFAEASVFDEAHRELISITRDYYADVLRLQQLLPPLNDDTIVTRMPPVLVRKFRKLYAERCRLLQYAEFFRVTIEGEELVMPASGTALMNDVNVFEYYLTIPGRRESGMERDERWASTLEYAAFAFRKLLRQLRWRGTDICTLVARPAAVLMNTCVFAKNDNAEGDRYREAILVVMRVFHTTCKEVTTFSDEGTSSVHDFEALAACSLLRVVRDAGVNSMLAKCKALHFGPMRGLLDVCTVATVLELLLCEDAVAEARSNRCNAMWSDLEVLLSRRKIVEGELYTAARGHRHYRRAARYGLLVLGPRVASALCDIVQSMSFLERYTCELAEWGSLIGRPLRLTIRDVATPMFAALLRRFPSSDQHRNEGDCDLGGKSVVSWTCGCSCANTLRYEIVSCTDCVSRYLIEHVWTCPHCSWVSSSGDYVDSCLACGRLHPRGFFVDQNGSACARTRGVTGLCLWVCDYCRSYSPLGVSEDPSRAQTCVDCGTSDSGWVTGVFEWKCGCGAMNSPLCRWCSVCSFGKASASCICVFCGEWWTLQPRHARSRDDCPACGAPHPRDTAAHERRLWHCPFCHCLTPNTTGMCHGCQRPMGVLSQFLALLPDTPWYCHACGGRHQIRDSGGLLLQAKAGEDNGYEVCVYCGVHRVNPILFNAHVPWACVVCGDVAVHGWCCRRCCSLHPAVPQREVHVWQCVVCGGMNDSWSGYCQHSGCGMRRSADATTLPYAPWRCVYCEKFSRTSKVPQCEHCGAVRLAEPTEAAGIANELCGNRLSELEAWLLSAASATCGNDTYDWMSELAAKSTVADEWSRHLSDSVQLSVSLA